MEGPFIYNKFVTGKNFIGHKIECSSLTNMLNAGENVSIYAPAKTGKMSLIQQSLFNMRAQNRIFTYCQVDLLRTRSISEFLLSFGDAVIRAYASTPAEYTGIIETYLSGTHFIFDQIVYREADRIVSLNWDVDDHDIESMLRLPYRLAEEHQKQMYMLLWEFQNIMNTEDGHKVCKIFYTLMKEIRDGGMKPLASFIFCGSQTNAMKDIFEHHRYFYRVVENLPIREPEDKDIIDHILRGFLSSGKVIDRELLTGICRIFRNNLWYINHFVSICDSLSKGYIMEPILVEALDRIISIHEPRFIAYMNDLTTFQVSLLKAILDGHKKFSTTEVIGQYRLNSSANIRRLKDALCKKEIITFNEKDEPVILDPLFEYWVRKTYFKMEVAR
ncbi:MAG: hypothetical protein MJY83_06420 [Bacteroidales bacterium]|nr:hypothetical protein [Bacteroidales bacterium]